MVDQAQGKSIGGIQLNIVESTTNEEWIKEALDRANEKRRNDKSDSLKLDENLQKVSQYWAYQLAANHVDKVHTPTVEESKRTTCDEHLYFRTNSKDYDFRTENLRQTSCKGTNVGIAYATNPEDGKTYVVTTYFPSAVSKGEFTENVLISPKKIAAPQPKEFAALDSLWYGLPIPIPPRRKKQTDTDGSDVGPQIPPRSKRLSTAEEPTERFSHTAGPKPQLQQEKSAEANTPNGEQRHYKLFTPEEPIKSSKSNYRPEVPPKPVRLCTKPVIPQRQRKHSRPADRTQSETD